MAGEGGAPKRHAHIAPADSGSNVGQIIAVGLIVAVVGGGGLWYLNRKGEDNKLNTLFASADAKHQGTSNGQRGNMTLGDGSTVHIGPATKLTIIPDYNKQYRGVMVDGTAGFDVKAVPNTPVELRVMGVAVVMNEGSVILRGYPDDKEGYIKIVSGSADVRAKDVHKQVTGPAALRVGKDTTVSDATADAADAATAWMDDKIVAKDAPLSEVLPMLMKYYALNLDVADKALLARTVSIEASLDSKQKAIDALEANGFKFYYEGSKAMLKDNPGGAKAAPKAAAAKAAPAKATKK
jgi:ferric-dicitrate binding protein FerR (iron transport regulator)